MLRPILAWHYTIGHYLPTIAETGVLMPATAGLQSRELPAVWFSLAQHWEPTATKMLQTKTGELRRMTFDELKSVGGLVRFGIEPRKLLCGAALRRRAHINNETWSQLCAVAAAQGANPANWFGHIGPMSVENFVIQLMDADGSRWYDVPVMQEETA